MSRSGDLAHLSPSAPKFPRPGSGPTEKKDGPKGASLTLETLFLFAVAHAQEARSSQPACYLNIHVNVYKLEYTGQDVMITR